MAIADVVVAVGAPASKIMAWKYPMTTSNCANRNFNTLFIYAMQHRRYTRVRGVLREMRNDQIVSREAKGDLIKYIVLCKKGLVWQMAE